MHYYKRNIGDYSIKAARLSMLQHGAYTLLMDACYDRERFPTKDEAIDWLWASSKEEVEAVEFVLNKFFELQESGHYVQSRIQDEVDKYHANSAINKRIAIDREAKRRVNSTEREQSVDESLTNRHLTKNQEPLTKNHKLSTGEKAKRFVPPEIDLINNYFKDKGSSSFEAEKFLHFYNSNGWKVGKNKMKCWKSSASGWISRNGGTNNNNDTETFL